MKTPIEHIIHVEKAYKKQVPDLKASGKANHLELESIVKKMTKKGGNVINPNEVNHIVVEGNKPVDISAKQYYFSGAGSVQTSKLAKRSIKVKEIMKQQGLSMTEASSYIKKNNIKY